MIYPVFPSSIILAIPPSLVLIHGREYSIASSSTRGKHSLGYDVGNTNMSAFLKNWLLFFPYFFPLYEAILSNPRFRTFSLKLHASISVVSPPMKSHVKEKPFSFRILQASRSNRIPLLINRFERNSKWISLLCRSVGISFINVSGMPLGQINTSLKSTYLHTSLYRFLLSNITFISLKKYL